MKQNTVTSGAEAPLVTKPARPVGAVAHCPCGRWNDSGLVRECPDCSRPVRGLSGFMGSDLHEERRAFARPERETIRDHLRVVEGGLSATAAYSLGLFVAQDVREASAR